MSGQRKVTVGAWSVSPALNVIERGERSIKLEPRAMDVLVYLADRPGDVVSVEELLGAVWKGVVVGDGSVYLAIKQLRQALAVPGDDTVYIETIPKRGYRLTVAAERIDGTRNTADTTRSTAPMERGQDGTSKRDIVARLASARVPSFDECARDRLSGMRRRAVPDDLRGHVPDAGVPVGHQVEPARR